MNTDYLIVGNWKMQLEDGRGQDICGKIIDGLCLSHIRNKVDVVICPSFIDLGIISEKFNSTIQKMNNFSLGSQDVSNFDCGSYTGEISAIRLANLGVTHVIVGHSERRILKHENDQILYNKTCRASESGLNIILCLGETLEEKERGMTYSILSSQIEAILGREDKIDIKNIIIAYEPVWSIGTGQVADKQYIADIIEHISSYCSVLLGNRGDLKILYGGSVNRNNVHDMLNIKDLNGFLIGGASIDPKHFLDIINAVTLKVR